MLSLLRFTMPTITCTCDLQGFPLNSSQLKLQSYMRGFGEAFSVSYCWVAIHCSWASGMLTGTEATSSTPRYLQR